MSFSILIMLQYAECKSKSSSYYSPLYMTNYHVKYLKISCFWPCLLLPDIGRVEEPVIVLVYCFGWRMPFLSALMIHNLKVKPIFRRAAKQGRFHKIYSRRRRRKTNKKWNWTRQICCGEKRRLMLLLCRIIIVTKEHYKFCTKNYIF